MLTTHRALVLALASSLACRARADWPWLGSRYFSNEGSQSDDVEFAGTPTESGFRTEGNTSCACDLTAAACDPNCCCDTSCSDTLRNELYDCNDAAVPRARADVRMCTDAVVDGSLPNTALTRAAWEAQDADNPLDRVLCVVVDNSASYGDFVTPIDKIEEESDFADVLRLNSSFGEQVMAEVEAEPADSTYEPGQPIRRGASSGSASVDKWAPLALPSAGGGGGLGALSGACDEAAPIRFLHSEPVARCASYFAPAGERSLASRCAAGTDLDASQYDGLRIGKNGEAPDTNGYETVTVSIARLERVTYGDVSRKRTELELADDDAVPAPSLFNASTCVDVLLEAVLRIQFDEDGLISGAEAYLVLADVPLGEAVVERAFGVLFEDDSADGDSRPRSGRPGYLPGLPVLSGEAKGSDDDPEVRQSTHGLLALVARAADGVCAFDAEPPYGPEHVVHRVLFGEDAIYSCELGWSLATLRRVCESEDQPYLLNATDERVGRYGDSQGSDPSDWLELIRDDPSKDPKWNEDELACSDLVTAAHITVLTSSYGASVDLQQQVVGVRLSFTKSTWRWVQSPRQLYTVTVAFASVPAGAAAEFVPPPPGIFAPLPDDVFFPFTVTANSITAAGRQAAATAAREPSTTRR